MTWTQIVNHQKKLVYFIHFSDLLLLSVCLFKVIGEIFLQNWKVERFPVDHFSFFNLILFCFNMFKTLWHLWKKIGMHETLAIKKYGFRAFSPIIKASHKPRTFTFHSAVWLHDSSPVVIIDLTEVFVRTVPSKFLFPFPWNLYLKTDGTSLLILSLAKILAN